MNINFKNSFGHNDRLKLAMNLRKKLFQEKSYPLSRTTLGVYSLSTIFKNQNQIPAIDLNNRKRKPKHKLRKK